MGSNLLFYDSVELIPSRLLFSSAALPEQLYTVCTFVSKTLFYFGELSYPALRIQ
jgi:hypothetical protein